MKTAGIIKSVPVLNPDGITTHWSWAALKAWSQSHIPDKEERQKWQRAAGAAYVDKDGSLLAVLLGEVPDVKKEAS